MVRFDNISIFYDKSRVEYPLEFIRHIKAKCDINKKGVYADMGCGSGKFTKRIIDDAGVIDGINVSKDMLCEAKNNLPENFQGININASDFIAPNKYDVIFLSHSFHWMNSEELLRNIYESLKDDGKIVIFWNNSLSRDEKWFKLIQNLVRKYHNKPISNHRGLDTIDQLEKSNHFKDIKKKEFHFVKTFAIDDYISLVSSKSYVSNDIPQECLEDFFEKLV